MSLQEITKLQSIYRDLLSTGLGSFEASNSLIKHATGGYHMGENGYPIVFFSGDFCLIDGNIYKKMI